MVLWSDAGLGGIERIPCLDFKRVEFVLANKKVLGTALHVYLLKSWHLALDRVLVK